ncbi:hypothetical protein HMPREF0058_0034 [Actinomyces urogenitalis DSM 15434]|uniref:Uncharacterized protein n=1 Tax=Actinomyces urogenitalis DSM 15434 TaxID=525246 RepID=C0W2E0_9ACTO|nr:hypothetical protein HMPREF0058_0034 [Actinomyces urogenitalis DSM 15434]
MLTASERRFWIRVQALSGLKSSSLPQGGVGLGSSLTSASVVWVASSAMVGASWA